MVLVWVKARQAKRISLINHPSLGFTDEIKQANAANELGSGLNIGCGLLCSSNGAGFALL
jgi:hypothetical protein